MPDLTLVQAINLALGRAMAEDPSVILLGEDIGADGGVFRATDGLLARFGSERVVDTPLAEAGIAGVSVGLAAQGFRPVAEIQFMGFAYSCLDQMLNHAARLRTRTQGRLSCPMVLRMPCGGGIHAPEHHSESGEACFTNVRGLRVVIPSSPARAYGLLLAAIRDPDPVVFLEPARLYRTPRETVEDTGKTLPLDRCFTLREGADITLVGWGGAISEVLAAAKSDPDAKPLTPDDLKRMKRIPRAKIIRRALGLTQEAFAARFRIPLGTLRDWEQGAAEPDTCAQAYLTVIAHNPTAVTEAFAP